ncbi:MAG: hypothetical protein KZQ77_01150 [Candidatus Thiodiazotropha sp. (ex Notomyrtea botanica)]|nr:hypothetical protein [Candidatus Thiodiazotropha sp. (ex Notomyrtea botanica)]
MFDTIPSLAFDYLPGNSWWIRFGKCQKQVFKRAVKRKSRFEREFFTVFLFCWPMGSLCKGKIPEQTDLSDGHG